MNKLPENINIKKITPTFTTVVTTTEKYSQDGITSAGLVDPTRVQGQLKEYQKVVAVGPSVRNCKPGDLVKIDPSRYATYAQRRTPNVAEEIEGYKRQLTGYNFRVVELDGEKCLLLQDSDIEYVIEEYESMDPPILLAGTPLITTN